jgi:hypothetical protein
MMAQLYLQAAGSFSFALHDSHGYSGGIPNHLHTNVLYDCYALHQYASILGIQLTRTTWWWSREDRNM